MVCFFVKLEWSMLCIWRALSHLEVSKLVLHWFWQSLPVHLNLSGGALVWAFCSVCNCLQKARMHIQTPNNIAFISVSSGLNGFVRAFLVLCSQKMQVAAGEHVKYPLCLEPCAQGVICYDNDLWEGSLLQQCTLLLKWFLRACRIGFCSKVSIG